MAPMTQDSNRYDIQYDYYIIYSTRYIIPYWHSLSAKDSYLSDSNRMSWGPLRAPRQQRVTGSPRESGDTSQILISLDTLGHLPDISQAPLVVSEYLWGSLELPGSPWDPWAALCYPGKKLCNPGCLWISLGLPGSLWESLGIPGQP